MDLERNPVVRLARRFSRSDDSYDGARFFTRTAPGRVLATPLLLVLLVVEWSDLVFAIDSIPAIFAVTRDPFLVYSSNIFAILGLRALFFVLAGMLDKLRVPEDRRSVHSRLRRPQDAVELMAAPAHCGVAGGHRHLRWPWPSACPSATPPRRPACQPDRSQSRSCASTDRAFSLDGSSSSDFR